MAIGGFDEVDRRERRHPTLRTRRPTPPRKRFADMVLSLIGDT